MFGVLGSVFVAGAQSIDSEPLLVRVGDYVEGYYTRAQTLVATETVTVQPLTLEMSNQGFARRVVTPATVSLRPRLNRNLCRRDGRRNASGSGENERGSRQSG